jgi:hypothetical protein
MYPFTHFKSTTSLAGAALTLLLGGALSASAQTFTFLGDLSDSKVVTVTSDGGATSMNGYAGRYKAQLGSGPVTNIFCVDINHEIHVGDTFAANTQYNITSPAGAFGGGYYSGGFASALTNGDIATLTFTQATARAGEVAFLADHYLNAVSFDGSSGSTNNVDNFAALNMSIWDIVEDGGDGLTMGQVQVGSSDAGSSDAAAYGSLVGYYENQAASHTDYTSNTAGWIQAPEQPLGTHFQDYVYEKPLTTPHGNPQAVPEPSLTAFGGCLSLVAGAFWLRRRKTAV